MLAQRIFAKQFRPKHCAVDGLTVEGRGEDGRGCEMNDAVRTVACVEGRRNEGCCGERWEEGRERGIIGSLVGTALVRLPCRHCR